MGNVNKVDMKNVIIVFEVSESSTVVTATGGSNKDTIYHMDLTHTEAEDKFIELLKIMQTMDAEIGTKVDVSK